MDDCPDWLMPGCKEKHNQLFDGQMLSTAKGTELLFFFHAAWVCWLFSIYCTIINGTSIVSYSFSYFVVRYIYLHKIILLMPVLQASLYMYTSLSVDTCMSTNNHWVFNQLVLSWWCIIITVKCMYTTLSVDMSPVRNKDEACGLSFFSWKMRKMHKFKYT